MVHTHCTRINLRDDSKSFVEFGEIDGTAFHAKWHNGFYTKEALLIVQPLELHCYATITH